MWAKTALAELPLGSERESITGRILIAGYNESCLAQLVIVNMRLLSSTMEISEAGSDLFDVTESSPCVSHSKAKKC